MSADIQQMLRYCRPRGFQPNPETETVSGYPQVSVRSRPRSPDITTAQACEEFSVPTTTTSLDDTTTHTHTHDHPTAQGPGPAHGQWWQPGPDTRLWELRKSAQAEPFFEGLVRRPRRGSADNSCIQRAVEWMSQAAWEAMLANALHPQGLNPRELPAPQHHLYVLRRLQETLQETRREERRLWDITPSPRPLSTPGMRGCIVQRSPAPHTDSPSPPR